MPAQVPMGQAAESLPAAVLANMPQMNGYTLKDTNITGGHISTTATWPDGKNSAVGAAEDTTLRTVGDSVIEETGEAGNTLWYNSVK